MRHNAFQNFFELPLILPQQINIITNLNYSSFSRKTFLTDLVDLTNLEMDFYSLLLYVLII